MTPELLKTIIDSGTANLSDDEYQQYLDLKKSLPPEKQILLKKFVDEGLSETTDDEYKFYTDLKKSLGKSIEEQTKANREYVERKLYEQRKAEHPYLDEWARTVIPRTYEDVIERDGYNLGRVAKDVLSFPGRSVAGLGRLGYDVIRGNEKPAYSEYTSVEGIKEGGPDLPRNIITDPLTIPLAFAGPAVAGQVGKLGLTGLRGLAANAIAQGVLGAGSSAASEAVEPTATPQSIALQGGIGGAFGAIPEVGTQALGSLARNLATKAEPIKRVAEGVSTLLPFGREMENRRIAGETDRAIIPRDYMEGVINEVAQRPEGQRGYEDFHKVMEGRLDALKKAYEQGTINAMQLREILPNEYNYRPIWNPEGGLGLQSSGDILGTMGVELGNLVGASNVKKAMEQEVFPALSSLTPSELKKISSRSVFFEGDPYVVQTLHGSDKPLDLIYKTGGEFGSPFMPSDYPAIQHAFRNVTKIKGPDELKKAEAIAQIAADAFGNEMRRPIGQAVVSPEGVQTYSPNVRPIPKVPKKLEDQSKFAEEYSKAFELTKDPYELAQRMLDYKKGYKVPSNVSLDPSGRIRQYGEIVTPDIDKNYAIASEFTKALKEYPARDVAIRNDESIPGLLGWAWRQIKPEASKSYLKDPTRETYGVMMDILENNRRSALPSISKEVTRAAKVAPQITRRSTVLTPNLGMINIDSQLNAEYDRLDQANKRPSGVTPVYIDRLKSLPDEQKVTALLELRKIK